MFTVYLFITHFPLSLLLIFSDIFFFPDLPLKLMTLRVNTERLEELLGILKLENCSGHLPGQLSGGQQQRAAIGRALLNAPALILADEPTGNLDSRTSQEIMELFQYSNRTYNQTLILITHDENIALQADRILRIEDGKLEFPIVKDMKPQLMLTLPVVNLFALYCIDNVITK